MMDKNSWLVAHFHNGFSYWIYGCMGVLAALFMWKFVPETKGKTLEELEALWEPETKKTQQTAVIFLSSTPRHFGVLTFYSRFSRFELHSHRVITSNRIAAE
jgi:predicted MFS family arabinose efflux permease